jgi:hypothetical protein
MTFSIQVFYINGVQLFRLFLFMFIPIADFHLRKSSPTFSDVSSMSSIYAMVGVVFECAKRVPSPFFPFTRILIPIALFLNATLGTFSFLPIILFYFLLCERCLTWTVARPYLGWALAFLLTRSTYPFFTRFLLGYGDPLPTETLQLEDQILGKEDYWELFYIVGFIALCVPRPNIEFEERFFPDFFLLLAILCPGLPKLGKLGVDFRATIIVICVTGIEKLWSRDKEGSGIFASRRSELPESPNFEDSETQDLVPGEPSQAMDF